MTKKIISLFLVLSMLLSIIAACSFEDTRERVEQWIANEIEFISTVEYDDPVYTVNLDVVFTNETTGTTFTLPAFWDGGTTWKIRYALTELGEWSWETVCTDERNESLNGLKGEVVCVEYTGDLDIYKHGFIKTEPGKRYFMYADGTPFFYLGDTHWCLFCEDIDGINPISFPERYEAQFGPAHNSHESVYNPFCISQETADQYGITSMFKYIMDYRAEQGFTVIQSQPFRLNLYNDYGDGRVGSDISMLCGKDNIYLDGVSEAIVLLFQEMDRYFEYIAEKGLVHANMQLTYSQDLIDAYLGEKVSAEEIDLLSRYWVARYAAYPVMWTTCQEGDNDHYEYGGCTSDNNPWLIVCESVAKYDPYDHPSSCHMENTKHVTPMENKGSKNVSESAFDDLECYSFYAMQHRYPEGFRHYSTPNIALFKEFYEHSNSKPIVNFEAKYDHYEVSSTIARMQAWIAYLNGQTGFGYGSQPIWALFWARREDPVEKDDRDEYNNVLTWVEGLYSEVSTQLIYLKDLLMQYEWWNLVPCFDGNEYYEAPDYTYAVSSIENKLYIGYFYGEENQKGNQKLLVELGTLKSMENADYEIYWMNCITGERSEPEIVTITDGTLVIPPKKDSEDYVFVARLIEEQPEATQE